MRKLILFFILTLAFVFAIFLFTLRTQQNNEIPESTPGPQADALMERILKAVHQDAWDRMAAVSFSFKPGEGNYFTDLKRKVSELAYEEAGKKVLVQFALDGSRCRAVVDGTPLSTDDAKTKCEESIQEEKRARFWLHPFGLISREAKPSLVGSRALLVEFAPVDGERGDIYQIVVDEDGLPTHWKTWSQAMPIGGIEASFEKWIALEGGARCSTLHRTFINEIEILDPVAYPAYPIPGEPDRFAELLGEPAGE